ncbi:hypothetical protein [Pseudomonas sp. 18173]|uniref:hypothetical protein n=1 Tax=Pseudomonas sp. 18173 TaxID=3390055 RepID=UPI003D1C282D
MDEAPEEVLDPVYLPAKGAVVRIVPYTGMAVRDHVRLSVGTHYKDVIPIDANAVEKDVEFRVAAKNFIANSSAPTFAKCHFLETLLT